LYNTKKTNSLILEILGEVSNGRVIGVTMTRKIGIKMQYKQLILFLGMMARFGYHFKTLLNTLEQ
jgi:hypothetical protein